MNRDQLLDEKLAVQKALLQHENAYGRPVSSVTVIFVLVSRVKSALTNIDQLIRHFLSKIHFTTMPTFESP